MLKLGRGFIAGLALAAVTATQAQAAGTWNGNAGSPYCGGNTFSTCISINMSWTVSSGTSTVVTVIMTNTSNLAGLKWFSVGLDNLPAGLGYTSGPSDLGFDAADGVGFAGGPFTPTIYAQGEPGGADPGLNVPRTFTFNLSSGGFLPTNWDAVLQSAGVGLHAGGVTVGGVSCSTKIVVRDNLAEGSAFGTNGPDGSHPECEAGDTNTSIPEPATMGLMALGLVGMGGVGFIRRRRKV
jgi:hypothetical protein